MSTAFVLSGGGNLGSVQVGMLLALAERGIRPDLVLGTSVGAINAAWFAGRPGPEGVRALGEVWRSVRRSDVFPIDPRAGLAGILGRRNFLVRPGALRSLLRRHLLFERLEDAAVPLGVVATEVTSGVERLLTEGDAVDAVMASASIPGVFPPVNIGGRELMDGGVANNSPVSHAVELGADRIYVLPTGYACALPAAPSSALGMVLQALALLVQQRLIIDVERYQGRADLRVIPPLCPVDVSPVDFGRSGELIERAHEFASSWVDEGHSGEDQAHLLSIHGHS